MLHATTLLYYCSIGILFYKEKLLGILRRQKKRLLLAICLTGIAGARAQDANQGLNNANTLIRGYYDTAAQLMYAIGGVLALLGALVVYSKLQNGHGNEAWRAGGAWFAGCIFLVIVATVIKTFFGLS
jgi:hypothetical protein